MNYLAASLILALSVAHSASFAKETRAGAPAPGTGSKPSSTHVNGYVKKDGTYVAPHQKSTPDKKFENNWGTKGNENAYTGKEGTRVSDPARK